VAAAALGLAASVACGPAPVDPRDEKPPSGGWRAGVTGVAPTAGTPGAPGLPDASVPGSDPDAGTTGFPGEDCDGFDNNYNGLIDEAIDLEPCELDEGGWGDTRCLDGELVCTECEPGIARSEDCGCDIKSVQLCSERGFWLPMGACDGCEQPAEPCEVCTPGERRLHRCDGCLPGEDCGATCMGAIWRCTSGCEWEQVSSCTEVPAVCDEDAYQEEACGQCGARTLACDGCFWTYGPCLDQGPCMPGESRTAPCISAGCGDGLTSTLVCGPACQWPSNPTCTGCLIGEIKTEKTECLTGFPCGEEVVQAECKKGPPIPLCDGAVTVFEGAYDIVEEVQSCELPCYPGQGIGCVDAEGQPGGLDVVCSETCEPPPPGAGDCVGGGCGCGGGCVPSEASTPCGCGAIEVTTVGCEVVLDPLDPYAMPEFVEKVTVDNTACPECKPDDILEIDCTDEVGQCGTFIMECEGDTCSYPDEIPPEEIELICFPKPTACVPNEAAVQEVTCGVGACEQTYTTTSTCNPDGCSWTVESTQDGSCPPCRQGETKQVDCTTAAGECGQMELTCDAACEWPHPSGECVPKPSACVPGDSAVQSFSCGDSACGATFSVRQTCAPDGCSYITEQDRSTCPECEAGQSEVTDEECIPGWPICGRKERICADDCTWQMLACPPCG